MKKGIKFLIILMFLIIIGLVTYIVLDKTVLSNKDDEKESSKSSASNGNENADEEILSEIKSKRFLAKNGIDADDVSIFEYGSIKRKGNPIYIILISYLEEGKAQNGIVFQATYKDGKVKFDVIEEHKYVSDSVAYDSKNDLLRLSASYHGSSRVLYYALNDEGVYSSLELAIADGSTQYDFKEVELTSVETTKSSNKEEKTEKETTTTTETTTIETSTKEDYSGYFGRWEDDFGDFEIKDNGNGYVTFSYSIIRLGGIDDATIPFSNGKGIFYYQGYDDANFNSVEDEGEHFYRKGTIELKNNTVVITFKDVEAEELNNNLNLDKSSFMGGAVYINSGENHTFTKKTK